MGTRSGGCQCGALRYEISGEPLAVAACHCRDCQRQSGSAFGMSMIVPRDAFRWTAGEPASFETRADSGALKQCTFCAGCGVRIYHALEGRRATFNVKPGTLDDTAGIEPVVHAWLSRKQGWVVPPEGTRHFERNPG